jgi:hypothetical protein
MTGNQEDFAAMRHFPRALEIMLTWELDTTARVEATLHP